MIPVQSLGGEMLLAILALEVVSVPHLALAVAVLSEFLEHTNGIGVVHVLIMLGKGLQIEEHLGTHLAIVRIVRRSFTFARIVQIGAHLLVVFQIVRFLLHDDIGSVVTFPLHAHIHFILVNGYLVLRNVMHVFVVVAYFVLLREDREALLAGEENLSVAFLRVVERLPFRCVLLAADLARVRIGKYAAVLRLDVIFQFLGIFHGNEADAARHTDLVSMQREDVHLQFQLILYGIATEIAHVRIGVILMVLPMGLQIFLRAEKFLTIRMLARQIRMVHMFDAVVRHDA